MKKLLIFAACMLALGACTEQASNELGAPIPSADVPLTTHSIDARTGGTLTYPSGTVIEIPENAFVDENGNAYTGQVDIDYREFHDMGAVLASGIPMYYNENGQEGHFETAGMFEIRGYARGVDQMQLFGGRKDRKRVFVAPGKTMQVRMASFGGEDNFNFYFFNEETQQWEYREPSVATPNEEKANKLNQMAPMPEEQPLEPKPFDENTPVFNFNVDTKDFPELKPFKGILWQYAGDSPEQDPSQPANNWVGKTPWSDISLKPTDAEGVYELSLKTAKKSFSMKVRPVLRGKDYEQAKARFDEDLAKFEEIKAKRKEAEDALASEGSFVRAASINRFGIFNHDILQRLLQPLACNATFSLSNGEAYAGNSVYVLTRENRGMIKQEKASWSKFYYPKDDAVIVAVLSNGRIGAISQNELSQLSVGESHNFELKIMEGVDSFEALSRTVEKLWDK
jgi:hypothetical protein